MPRPVVVALCLLLPHQVLAQDGPTLEIYRGPVLGPANVVGMGGAHIAMGQGSSGVPLNPAAVANRYPHNLQRTWDWDVSFDTLLVGSGGVRRVDLENNGRLDSPAVQSRVLVFTAGYIQKRFGVGLEVVGLSNEFCRDSGAGCELSDALNYKAFTVGLALGYSFREGEIVVGGEIQGSTLDLEVPDGIDNVVSSFFSVGIALGGLWQPFDTNLRLGVTYRSPRLLREDVSKSQPDKVPVGVSLPSAAQKPWELGLGFAYRAASVPLNQPVRFEGSSYEKRRRKLGEGKADDEEVDPADLEAEKLEGFRYHLFTADLVLIGSSENAVGIQSWIAGELQSAGRKVGVSPRLGFETEFWPNRMRGRAGSYYEPPRFEGVPGRLHGTVGLDLRIGKLFWQWRITVAFDYSRRYNNTVLSLGFWR